MAHFGGGGPLGRFGKLDRFGVVPLHQHFEMAPNEVLVETIDPRTRTLTSTPRNLADVPDSIATTWQLGVPLPEVVARCIKVCPGGSTQDHYGYKVHQSV